MIHKIAEIEVISGTETAFEAAVAEAAVYFRTARGCRSFVLNRVIENPQSYYLIVGWDNIDDHVEHFRKSLNFQAWTYFVKRYLVSEPKIVHVEAVVKSF